MRRLTYYIATTIDGFICGPGGEFDFFPMTADVLAAINAEWPETVPSHLRGPAGLADAPNRHFDTVLMGRGSYEPGLAAGVTSPYAHLRQIVFSRTLTVEDPAVEVVSGEDPVEVVRRLKREDGLGIWLCGGADLAGQLLPEIDELIVKRYPVVAGAGKPMFGTGFGPVPFTLAESRTFESGTVVGFYQR
ncbi:MULTISPECIES: dihydrofolate reductase family protein [Catenuloplanes]|uniref:Dihydrofolate reductase n=1 Tax=Catenuloplanes niger TaxID=587534 RepID=A0AAE3ZVF2_9ACTN|nr:dihydrofolate reductase family protein [Catenuloplanes niger]MDR7326617.1 dihydrofolate reductase [Catenuloplanes niger]